MHYKMLLITPECPTDKAIDYAMEPYCERKWDWFQVGGRYTGSLDGYDPEKDPANVETCTICHGTGRRDDELGRSARARDPSYTCNGCDGEGRSVKWPTQWKRHPGDMRQIKDVEPGRLHHAYAFLVDRRWRDRDDVQDEKQWMAQLTEALSVDTNAWVTVVDYHM